jgi:APA family basic amino acid/polyamine antiporter
MWRVKSVDAILATAEAKSLHRSLGAVQLTLLGLGAVIGTGIFVLTSEAAQKAGPAMMLSFVIAAAVCGVAALCYAELTAMVPVAGSAYTYAYAAMGEPLAWLVGWALVLEYAVAAGAVAVGWSGYIVGLVEHGLGITLPAALTSGPYAGGLINLPAVLIVAAATGLLMLGTRESARLNAVLVAIKIAALTTFIALSVPVLRAENFHPFAPLGAPGVFGAAGSIFFAYLGFDAVSTAAEETRNPQRNLPIGLVASLLSCTLFYLLVAVGAVGAYGAAPLLDAAGHALSPGSAAMTMACNAAAPGRLPLVCSHEALAHVLRAIGHSRAGDLIGLAAGLALPSVILMLMFGQSRIFFAMARDGLLPPGLARIHPRLNTPYLITGLTGLGVALAAAFLPVGALADISNSGTLFAFTTVALAVLILRRTDPGRRRPFRTPAVGLVAPLAMIGCVALFLSLPTAAKLVFPAWSALGLAIYGLYGVRRSHLAVKPSAAGGAK